MVDYQTFINSTISKTEKGYKLETVVGSDDYVTTYFIDETEHNILNRLYSLEISDQQKQEFLDTISEYADKKYWAGYEYAYG